MEQKHSKKKAINKKDYSRPGKSLTELEFVAMVKESEESGYISLHEFKNKCKMFLNLK